VASVPVTVQFWHRIVAVTVQRRELVRSLQRLVGTSLPRPARNIAATIRSGGALLSLKECLVHPDQLRRTLKSKKTLVLVVAGFIGLILIFSLLEFGVMREIQKRADDAAIDGLPAASANVQQIEFADRFAIQPKNAISFEAVQADAPVATSASQDTGTSGHVFRELVPLPRPRKPR
jgi:hypothetical protein